MAHCILALFFKGILSSYKAYFGVVVVLVGSSEMWRLGTWFSGRFGSAGLLLGLDLRGLFRPKLWFCGSWDPGRILGWFGRRFLLPLLSRSLLAGGESFQPCCL